MGGKASPFAYTPASSAPYGRVGHTLYMTDVGVTILHQMLETEIDTLNETISDEAVHPDDREVMSEVRNHLADLKRRLRDESGVEL